MPKNQLIEIAKTHHTLIALYSASLKQCKQKNLCQLFDSYRQRKIALSDYIYHLNFQTVKHVSPGKFDLLPLEALINSIIEEEKRLIDQYKNYFQHNDSQTAVNKVLNVHLVELEAACKSLVLTVPNYLGDALSNRRPTFLMVG